MFPSWHFYLWLKGRNLWKKRSQGEEGQRAQCLTKLGVNSWGKLRVWQALPWSRWQTILRILATSQIFGPAQVVGWKGQTTPWCAKWARQVSTWRNLPQDIATFPTLPERSGKGRYRVRISLDEQDKAAFFARAEKLQRESKGQDWLSQILSQWMIQLWDKNALHYSFSKLL